MQALLYVPIRGRHRLSRAMTHLRPEIEALKKEYAKDQTRLNQALQGLYRRYNLNPLSGCLMLIIQMPILFAVWRTVRVQRVWEEATFLWIQPGRLHDSYPNLFAADLAHFDLVTVIVCVLGSILALRGNWGKDWTESFSLYLIALLSHWPAALVLFWGAVSVTNNLIRSSVYRGPELQVAAQEWTALPAEAP